MSIREQILQIIKGRVGRENAVKVRELVDLIDLRDPRNVRRRVRDLKLAGHPIASCAAGYYTPDESDDCCHTIAILKHEEKQIRVVRQVQERAFKRVFPGYAEQLTFA